MAKLKKSIKILSHERTALVALYLRRRIALDQYENRPEDQQTFRDEWQQLTGREDSFEELLHYMRTQRKRGLWVKLDGKHEPAKPPPHLSAEETEVLVKIYTENVTLLEVGSDVLGYEPELLELLAKEFAAETGRVVPAYELNAKLTALRKRGLLSKVGKRGEDSEDHGFGDIDQATA